MSSASRRLSRAYRIALAGLASAALASMTAAQVRPSLPGPTREELQRGTPPPAAPPTPARVDARGAVAAGPCPEALLDSPITVPLRGVRYVGPGDTPLPPGVVGALDAASAAYAGKRLDGSAIPIRAVCALRDAAEVRLKAAGYIAAVQVPPQAIGEGSLKLVVVTARIVELRIRGNPGRNRDRLAVLLNRLKALDPLNEHDAERILLLAGDIPGVNLALKLRSADRGPGEVIGEVQIDAEPGEVVLSLNNVGSQQIGPWGGLVRAEAYGLAGAGDRAYLGFFATTQFREQDVLQAGYDFLPGAGPLRLATQFTYSWSQPTIEQVSIPLDYETRSLIWQLGGSYPLLRSLNRSLSLSGGFALINQPTWVLGDLLSRDKLRLLNLRLDGDWRERSGILPPAWSFTGGAEISQGLAIFGASAGGKGTSRFFGDPTAFVLQGNLLTELRARLGPEQTSAITLSINTQGQWANQPLLAYQEYQAGNLTIGRGYDPGTLAGDRAIGAGSELRIGRPQPASATSVATEFLGFYDVVRLWNIDPGQEGTTALHSVGGGIRATWGSRGRIELLYAHPLDNPYAQIGLPPPSERLLLTLTLRAWPWRSVN